MATTPGAADDWMARVPPGTEARVRTLLTGRRVVVKLSRPRRSKLGDHRPPGRGRPHHRVTVNDDLNPYAFLTTLLHEIAHVTTWERLQPRVRYAPHGRDWKREFAAILAPFVADAALPEDVAAALGDFMRRPAAASCTDRGLVLALARYDRPAPGLRRVEDLAAGSVFRVESGRLFRLGPRLRSRYRCFAEPGGQEYRVHGLSRVAPVGLQSGP